MNGAPDPRQGGAGALRVEGATTIAAFGKYQLFASLGRGGMADVFLSVARGQMGFNKLAVIKRLRQALAEEPAFRTMFLDEARLAARLNHPNVVHTYEVGEQDGAYFIAMEYLEGQSLNKVLKEALRRKEMIAPEICARIVADALAGLYHAHTLADYDGSPLQIIHRDVSPHNVFVTYDGHTKLVDFGIAKAALSTTETEVGVLKGKVAYMSPEQAMAGPIDCRSDLFAMGIVLWELVARKRLLGGENAANTLHRLMNEPIPRLSEVLPSIDPTLDLIVAHALEKDPRRRFQSAAEMKETLEAWIDAQPRLARQDDVGRMMQGLFQEVREDVQRKVQRHMAAIVTATTTEELHALTADSLKRLENAGAELHGPLLRLDSAGGSGSDVVPQYRPHPTGPPPPAFAPAPSAPPLPLASLPPQPQPPPLAPRSSSSNNILIVTVVGCFALLALMILVVGLRNEEARVSGPVPSPSTLVPAPTASVKTASVKTAPSASAVAAASSIPVRTATAASTRAPTTAPTTAAPVRTSHRTTTSRSSGSKASASPAPSPPPPPPPPPEDPGFLTINTIPWSRVTANGKVVCATTPCFKVPMAPGSYVLSLENAEKGIKKKHPVTIKSGETVGKTIDLSL